MTRKQIKFFKHTIIGIGALTPIVLVVFLIFGMARIPANTVGVKVSAFNGVSNKTMPTGWHLKMPFVDKVYKLPTSVQTKSLEKLTTQTKDGQWLNTNIDVKYRVEKAKAMTVFQEYTNLENINNLVISPAVQRAIESVTGEYDIYDILGEKRTEVYEKIDDKLKTVFKKHNLEFVSFTITDQDAGDEIEQAIKDESVKQKQVDSAKQDKEKALIEAETKKINAQAEADSSVIKAKGESEANQLKANSITDSLIRMKEAEAREKHGWVEVITNGQVITDQGE